MKTSFAIFVMLNKENVRRLFSRWRFEPAYPGSPSKFDGFQVVLPVRVSVCSGDRMNTQNESDFQKTVACPSSNTLLSYRAKALSRELLALVRLHLTACEFCTAELALLAFHTAPSKADDKSPEIPMNLRILAESLLCQSSKLRMLR